MLAAGTAPPFFTEVAALLVASALLAFLAHRLKVTPIVAFLLTGTLIGPQGLALVTDRTLIEAVAEVGVVLLLFTIGIELSLAKLGALKRLIFLGGGLQVGLVLAAVTGILVAAGVDWRAGLFTGCLVALSSTAIVLKLLMSRGETDTEVGRAALGILIFQDLAVVAMVLLVPMLGDAGGSPAAAGWALAKAGAIVAIVLVVARRGMPAVLEAVARTCSQEIFVLTVMAICFGTAWLTSMAGVSLSLGAFLAGLVVSESRFSDLAFGEIQPLQILFSATFFVSVGLLLDLRFLVAHLPLVLGVVAAILVLKAAAAGAGLWALGYGLGTAGFSSLLIAQVGEFSFVLERSGREAGLYPAGFAEGGPQTFIAATVISMMVTPLLALLGERLERLGARRSQTAPQTASQTAPEVGASELPRQGHVVIAGYGRTGRALVRELEARDIPYLIVTLSPAGAREAEAEGRPVLRGNYGRQHELGLAGIDGASLLVVADDDLETTQRVVRAVRALHSELPIVAASRLAGEVAILQEAGAGEVVAAEVEGSRRLIDSVLARYGHGPNEPSPPEALRDASPHPGELRQRALDARQRANPRCTHQHLAVAVNVDATGCAECLALGARWVHLRVCLTCGHVGCCDESPHRHATAHAREADHPLIASLEPGESWAWCYRDEIIL